MPARHWTETFFSETYRRLDLDPRQPAAPKEATAIKKALRLRKGQSVLDLGCGIGRHTIALAKLGLEVTGLDLNPGYLRRARAEARRQKTKVRFVQGDIRQLRWESIFHAAISVFTSFGYYDDVTNLRVMKNFAHVLRPGGKFLIETMNRDRLMGNFQTWDVHEMGKTVVLRRQEFNPLTGRLCLGWRLLEGGRVRELGQVEVRIYSASELQTLLKTAGFRVQAVYGGFDLSEFHRDSRRLAMVCERSSS